jgi:alpha/beta superfamily hydrolase
MTRAPARPGERVFLEGAAGKIEAVIDSPDGARSGPRGIALVAHPHPLYGGTLDNKVAQTIARTFVELGWIAVRPNFRGVGASEGVHDHGEGETEDMVAVARQAAERHPGLPQSGVVLAGFSFGAFVQTRVAKRIPARRLVLVAPPSGPVGAGRSYVTEGVPADTIVIHGELDETVPLANVFAWARPQELPIVVIPGADHFFHRRLHLIRNIVKGAWHD